MGSQTPRQAPKVLWFCSCRRLFFFAAIAVLLFLIGYRYAFFSDYRDQHVPGPSDSQHVVVASNGANNETTFNEERGKDEYFASARGNASLPSHDTNIRREQWTRYVIALNYWEQLTMATNNLFRLLWFSKQWNASVIMPFVKDSHFYGLWKRSNNETALPLDLLYDRSQFNSLLESYHLPPLVTMETFLTKARRSLIVLQLFYNGDALGAGMTLRFNRAYVYDCSDTICTKRALTSFVRNLNERATSPFAVKACYCVNASHEIYPDKLAEIIGIQGDSDASVIFNNWHGISESDTKKATSKGSDRKKGRMPVSGYKKGAAPSGGTVTLPYSLYVRRNASNFIRSLNVEAEFAAVHLRSERLGERDERTNGYFAQCWEEVMRILQTNILPKRTNITVLYFTDYGLLGSSSCLRKNCRGAIIANAMLAKNGLKATCFDPAKFNAVSDSGFAALVEQSVMAMSQYLLLVGGGSFEMQIYQQFKSQPTAKGGYSVCLGDKVGSRSFT